MEEKKITLKAKKNQGEDYSIYYPKTTWDNVLTEDNQYIDTYLDENFYKKGEIDSKFMQVGENGDFYTKDEIDEKIDEVVDDMFKMDEAHSRKYIANDYATNSSIKAPSMNLFKQKVGQNTNKITEITDTILDMESSKEKVFVNCNGEVSGYKLVVFDTTITIPVNTSDNTYMQKTISIPATANLSTMIYSNVQLSSEDYICTVKNANLENNKLYLSVGKLNDKFLENMEIDATVLIIGK